MNDIEKGKFDEDSFNEAFESIIPPVIADNMLSRMVYKSEILSSASINKIIEKANILYVQRHIIPYLDFFIKYLECCGERAEICSIDYGYIYASIVNISNKNEFKKARYESSDYYFGANAISWLKIYKPNNKEFKRIIDSYWQYSPIMYDEDENLYIKLLPADTVFHFHELYKIMCFYL